MERFFKILGLPKLSGLFAGRAVGAFGASPNARPEPLRRRRSPHPISIPSLFEILEPRLLLSASPGSFTLTDIGSPSLPGFASFNAPAYSVAVSSFGGGLSAGSDGLTVVGEPFAGSGSAVAKVGAVPNTGAGAQAGLMLRDSSSATSAYAAVTVNAAGDISVDYRAADGGTAAIVNGPSITAGTSVWLALSETETYGVNGANTVAFAGSYSTDGVTFNPINSTPIDVTFTGGINLAGLEVASGGGSYNTTTFNGFSVTPATVTSQDIGGPGVAGGTLYSPVQNQWGVTGSGSDIYNNSDQFQFASQAFTGDGGVTARITSMTNTNAFAKTGVMLRDTNAANSAFVDLVYTNTLGLQLLYRSTAGAAVQQSGLNTSVTGTPYLRLWRQGNVYSAYYSMDGVNWSQVGAQITVGFSSANNLAGLVECSHNNSAADTATFTNFSVTNAPLMNQDIGNPGIAGSGSYNSATGVWTLSGSGSDIWNTSDQFTMVGQNFIGSGTVIARVASMQNADAFAKTGIMIRDGNGANAAFVDVVYTNTLGLQFLYRASAGANAQQNGASTAVTGPFYLKLVNSGGNFSAYYSLDGTNYTQIGATQAVNFVNPVSLAGLVVCSHNNADVNTSTFDTVSVTPAAALPAGYSDGDIGVPPYYGAAAYNSTTNTWTVAGSGSDIWNAQDQFNFVSSAQTGDGQISAEVLSQTYTDPWAKAGVMMRANNSANSPFVDVVVTPGNGVAMNWRDGSGNLYNYNTPSSYTAPLYVMLQRQGNVFTGFLSTDNVHWTAINSVTIAMTDPIMTGLVASSHNQGAVSAATFGSVATGPVTAVTSLPLAPTISFQQAISPTDIYLGWINRDTALTVATGFELQMSTDGGSTYNTIATIAAGNNLAIVHGLSPNTPYTLRLITQGANGNSQPGGYGLNVSDANTNGQTPTPTGTPSGTGAEQLYKVTIGKGVAGDAGITPQTGGLYIGKSGQQTGTVEATSAIAAVLKALQGSVTDVGPNVNVQIPISSVTATPTSGGGPSVTVGGASPAYMIGGSGSNLSLQTEIDYKASSADGETGKQDVDFDDGSVGITAVPQPAKCSCDSQKTSGAAGAGGNGAADIAESSSGVNLAQGTMSVAVDSVTTGGFGMTTGADLSWSSDPAAQAGSGSNGNGVVDASRPYLSQAIGGAIIVNLGGGSQLWFAAPAAGGSVYTPSYYNQEKLVANSSGGFTLTDTTGTQVNFYGFSGVPAAQQGQYAGYTDAAGNSETAGYSSSTGQLTSISRVTAGQYPSESLSTYAYTPSGQINDVLLQVQSPGGTLQTVRHTYYSYYGGTYTSFVNGQPVVSTPADSAYGNSGDLRTVTVVDGSGNVIHETYYRYYTSGDVTNSSGNTVGYVGGMMYSFGPQAFVRLQAAIAADVAAGTLPSGTTPLTAPEATVAPFADTFYQYDSSSQVSAVRTNGQGGANSTAIIGGVTVATPGIGTTTYAYATNPSTAYPGNYSMWTSKTTETLPDGSQHVVYTNFAGEVIMKMVVDNTDVGNPALSNKVWITAYKFDSAGRILQTINPSAINLSASILNGATTPAAIQAALESYSDLGLSEGLIQATTGLINSTTYYTSTTATATAPGGVAGYTEAHYVQQGLNGTPIQQDITTYIAQQASPNNGGATVYPVAATTTFQSSNSGGSTPETTTNSYTWQVNGNGVTNQQASATTTLPAIPTNENGSGVANSSTDVFDQFGRVVWTKDAAGYITYTAYDNATGATIQSVQDVNTNDLSGLANYQGTYAGGTLTFSNGFNQLGVPELPSGWTTPSNGGLNLITTTYVDSLGRTIDQSSPSANPTSPATTGNITLTVHDDTNHATYTLPGVVLDSQTGTLTTTGPVSVSRTRIPYTYVLNGVTYAGTYSETVTMSANAPIAYTQANSASPVIPIMPGFTGALVNLGTQYTIQTLSRSLNNSAGQSVETDQYFNITNALYNSTAANSPYSGTRNTNFYASTTGYDLKGRAYQSIDANGTITDTVFDSLDRSVATWVGTNDATSNGQPFNGTNAGTGNNMTQTSSTIYDNNGVGDGNVTETIAYPDGNTAGTQRVTLDNYDFRDRSVSTETGLTLNSSGAIAQAASVPFPMITVNLLDNMGDAFSSYMFNGNAISMASTAGDGIPNALESQLVGPGSSGYSPNLRGFTASGFDLQNRTYIQQTYSVDPTTGNVSGTALLTYTYFGPRGNTIETIAPSGQVTKDVFDGAGRNTFEYVTDGGAVNNGGVIRMDYASASSVANDVVLTQTQNIFDGDSNNIETIVSDRFNTDATTATGALGTPTTGVLARVSYVAAYFDNADRITASVDAGTNGGQPWSRPANTIPAATALVLVTLTGYNPAGWVDTTTDPRGIVQKNNYDTMGRTVQVIAAYNPNVNNGLPTTDQNQTTDYTFDGIGDQTSMTAVEPAGTPNETTNYIYGVSPATGSAITSNDILQQTQYPQTQVNGTNVNNVVSDAVNALGEVIQKTDRNGTVHDYTFDNLGRQISDVIVTLGAGVDGAVRRIDTAYNDAGLPYLFTSFADTAGTIIANQVMDIYNGLGQVIREYQAVNGAVDTSTTPFVQYDYSAPTNGSRLADMVYPNGRTVDYNYTGTNNNSALDNAIGRLVSISDGANSGDPGQVLEQYSYLGLSTIVQAAHPQTGINLTYIQQPGQTNILNDGGDIYTGLDRFGRVIDQNWWVVATGTSTDRFQYGYDPNSNVLYKNNLVNPNMSELYHANSSATGDNNAAYDPISRETAFARGILSASGNNPGSAALDTIANPTQSQTWNLDALGNWSSSTTNGTAQTRNFNSQNQITGISGTTATPAYDPSGNMTTDQNGNKLKYDAWNRLVQVTNAAGQIIAKYSYNAMGYRISESYPQGGNGVAAGTVKYLYYSNNWQVLETRWNGTAATDVTHQYAWSQMYIDAMVLRDTYSAGAIQPAQRIYYQHDANFNTTAIVGLVGSTWQVTQRYIYTPYGVVTVLNADWTTAASQIPLTQYLHQGGRLDPITGLYDFRNRDYSPVLGNWIEQDPAGYVNGGNTYVGDTSNPSLFVDPFGTTVLVKCIKHYLNQNFVTNFNAKKSGNGFYYSGLAKFKAGDLVSEILAKMITSHRFYDVKRLSVEELKRQVRARVQVVHFAQSVSWHINFHPKRRPPLRNIWMPGSPLSAGLVRAPFANGGGYRSGCFKASLFVELRAILSVVGGRAFQRTAHGAASTNVAIRRFLRRRAVNNRADWIPGDWGWIQNTGPSAKTPLFEGENIIYLGGGKFWGFGDGLRGGIGTYQQIHTNVIGWSAPGTGGARLRSFRDEPRVGIQ